MRNQDSDLEKFSRLIEALRPWLGQVIFIGGRAHRLYRARPEAAPLAYEPLQTDDADVAIDPRTFRTSESIRGRLKEFNFEEEFSGDDQPPITHYGLGQKEAGFYAEFLTPLVGGEYARDGSRQVTERVGGVIAQKLRYLDVLLVAPWSVMVTRETGFEVPEPTLLQIPNPTSYLVQKLLIHDRRKPSDRPKDVLYIHDTIELFAASLPALTEAWRTSLAPTLHDRTKRLMYTQVDSLFGAVNDTVREAARMVENRRLSPVAMTDLCRTGLEEILSRP